MIKFYQGLGLPIMCGFVFVNSLIAGTAKITVKVVDDNGTPVGGFPVNAGTYEGDSFQGVTDTNGFFVIEGTAIHWEISWVLQKENYYRSHGQYDFKGGTKDGKWQPWNPTVTTVVRRISNPISMYTKRIETMIPVENVPVGYDFFLGDWVAPYGGGQVPDMMFKMTRRITAPNDYEGTLLVTFTNTYDGIQIIENMCMDSTFQYPRFAPTNGYQSTYIYMHGKSPTKGYYGAEDDDPPRYYFFRVRSVLDYEGKLKEAMYGKILGAIAYAGAASPNKVRILFTYYLNPTLNDRNMEFDPKRNLLQNLKSTEEVCSP